MSSLSIGIVGLPNVGKSTLFNALTQKGVPAENYPFCTIDPAVGIVAVPDERVDFLAHFSKSAKRIPAAIEFVDIAGLVKGASEGEGLGNKFLAHIREVDAIAEVVRIYEDSNITHVSNKIDPIDDIETINLELILADLQTVAKRLSGLAHDARRGDKPAQAEETLLQRVEATLKTGKLASDLELTDEETKIIKSLQLLSSKPILYVLNKKTPVRTSADESATSNGAGSVKLSVIDYLEKLGANWVVVDAKIEGELSELEQADRQEFKQELGVEDDGINDLIKESYNMLGLITYLTTGEDETRAWTIKKGWTAPEAGTAIHTDFKDKFIRAEVVAYEDLVGAGSYANARDKGLVRTEGKDYVVKDGDVIEFKI